MQNIDFSRQIKNSGLTRSGAASQPVESSRKQRRNRWISLGLAGVVIIFALGFYFGVRLGELHQVEHEDCVIRNPSGQSRTDSVNSDNPQTNPTTVASTGTGSTVALSNTGASQVAGSGYIIKVGIFQPEAASTMADRLNAITELKNLKPDSCKGVQENVPNRGMAFRMQAQKGQALENVLVGCFKTAGHAHNTLAIIRRSGLPGVSRAELYEY